MLQAIADSAKTPDKIPQKYRTEQRKNTGQNAAKMPNHTRMTT
jgi:hypothetical protein